MEVSAKVLGFDASRAGDPGAPSYDDLPDDGRVTGELKVVPITAWGQTEKLMVNGYDVDSKTVIAITS